MSSVSPRKVLRDLLCDIFNAHELRRFVDYVDRALTAELREQVSLRELAGNQAADRTLEIFLGVAATPPLEALEAWRTDLHADDLTVRARAAVALAMSGQQDTRVVDGLIDTWIAESAGWKVAFDLMRAPEVQELFKERRRARATTTSFDPEGAWDLVNLWGPDEVAEEPDIVAGLLRTASTHEL